MEPDSKELLMQKRENESNYKVRIRGLHNNSWGCDKNQSKLSAGVRDRWVAVSIMEKWWFRAISRQGTKTKCKGETEQQISPPLMKEKPLLSFSVTDLFPLTTHKSRQSEIREWNWSANITDITRSFPFSELSLAEGLCLFPPQQKQSISTVLTKLFWNPETAMWKPYL